MRRTTISRAFKAAEAKNRFSSSNQQTRLHRSLSVDADMFESSEYHQRLNLNDANSEEINPDPFLDPPSNTYLNWSKANEEVELDNYIYKTQLDSILKNYLEGIKKTIVAIFFISVTLIGVYHMTGLSSTPSGRTFVEQAYFFIFYLSV